MPGRDPGLTLRQLSVMLDEMIEYMGDEAVVVVDAGAMTGVLSRPVTGVYTRGASSPHGAVVLCYDTLFSVGSERVR